VYLNLLGRPGLYHAESIRKEIAEPFASVRVPIEDEEAPAIEFVQL
jgi:hypothetical protein